MFLRILIAAFALFFAPTAPLRAALPDRPEPRIARALIISIDGLRPDLLLRADTPRLHQMLKDGSFSMWARTTPASVTLPSHVSMLTGVPPEVHGVMWNSDLPLSKPVYPAVSTLFARAKRAGYSTAMCAGKSKFDVLSVPGTIDWKFVTTGETSGDGDVLENALRILREHQPEVMFVHFAETDNVGHAKGWGSPEQMAAIAGADTHVAALFKQLEELKLLDSTVVIVTSDHGGAGRTHGPEDPRSRTIPWIAVGSGIRKGFDLTLLGGESNVETYDTTATTCALLGIKIERRINGKFVAQILENVELTVPGRPPNMAPSTSPTTKPSE